MSFLKGKMLMVKFKVFKFFYCAHFYCHREASVCQGCGIGMGKGEERTGKNIFCHLEYYFNFYLDNSFDFYKVIVAFSQLQGHPFFRRVLFVGSGYKR